VSKDKYDSKYAKVLREFKAGQLRHGGSGQIVRRDDVAKAIAHSEATKASKGRRKKKRRGNLRGVLKKHYGGRNEN
jgi:hypothetical protein